MSSRTVQRFVDEFVDELRWAKREGKGAAHACRNIELLAEAGGGRDIKLANLARTMRCFHEGFALTRVGELQVEDVVAEIDRRVAEAERAHRRNRRFMDELYRRDPKTYETLYGKWKPDDDLSE
jgi:hypothetical protein